MIDSIVHQFPLFPFETLGVCFSTFSKSLTALFFNSRNINMDRLNNISKDPRHALHHYILWLTLTSIILFLSIDNPYVSCDSFHVYKNRLYYYNGIREMALNDTEELCNQLGGELPSVHNQEDTNFIIRLIGRNARVWLGGERMSSTPGVIEGTKNFTWMDGSPMDYFPFVADHEVCRASCCGIGYTTVVSPGLVVKECASRRRMVCALTSVTQNLQDTVLNSTVDVFHPNSSAFQAIKILSNLNFDLLNETLIRAKEERRDNEKITSLTNDLTKLADDTRASLAKLQTKLDGSLNMMTVEMNILTVQLNKQKNDIFSTLNSLNQSLIQNSKRLMANVTDIQGKEEQNYRTMSKSASYHTDAIIGMFTLLMCLGLVFYFRDSLSDVGSRASAFMTYVSSGGRRPPSTGTTRRQRLKNELDAGQDDKDCIFTVV